MRGIGAILHFDGHPVDPGDLTHMARELSSHGPDSLLKQRQLPILPSHSFRFEDRIIHPVFALFVAANLSPI